MQKLQKYQPRIAVFNGKCKNYFYIFVFSKKEVRTGKEAGKKREEEDKIKRGGVGGKKGQREKGKD